MAEPDFEELLNDFVNDNVETKHAAFRKLIAIRKHNKASKDNRFIVGIEQLYKTAAEANGKELDRLLALATLGRIASAIRSIRKEVYKNLETVLIDRIPYPYILDDVDDRAYIGQICSNVLPEWTTEYAARVIVDEETGEQVRRQFLKALLKSDSNLDKSINNIILRLEKWTPNTEDPGLSIAIRLKRIMSALCFAISEVLPDTGENPGNTLSKIIKASFSNFPSPKNNKVILDLAEEVARVVHEMVRLRFSLATDSYTYSVLRKIMTLVPDYVWEKFSTKSKSLAMISQDISEAILILARQGIPDTALADQLIMATGNRKRSLECLKNLATKPGLSPEIKTWLVDGKINVQIKTFSESGESKKLSEDAQLADLFVDSLRYRSADEISKHQIFPEIGMLNPRLLGELERLSNYGLGLCDVINSMAKRRGLHIRGTPGEEVNYSPLDHEITGGATGSRRVRIVRPVVEQIREDGIPFTLRKGLVESIK
jgi:hypothetical protein